MIRIKLLITNLLPQGNNEDVFSRPEREQIEAKWSSFVSIPTVI